MGRTRLNSKPEPMWLISTSRPGAQYAEASWPKRIMHGCWMQCQMTLGAFDAKILTWLANYEPETCAVITGLITRANRV